MNDRFIALIFLVAGLGILFGDRAWLSSLWNSLSGSKDKDGKGGDDHAPLP